MVVQSQFSCVAASRRPNVFARVNPRADSLAAVHGSIGAAALRDASPNVLRPRCIDCASWFSLIGFRQFLRLSSKVRLVSSSSPTLIHTVSDMSNVQLAHICEISRTPNLFCHFLARRCSLFCHMLKHQAQTYTKRRKLKNRHQHI